MNTKQFRLAAAFGGVLLAASALAAPAPVLEKPTKFVTDHAHVLPLGRAAALNEKLAQFERDTSNQVLVYLLPRVPEGTTMEELASASFRAWGVGQKGKSNGLIFFVFPEDRKMRVEVGYGLEGAIPDARSHRITDEIVKPFFVKGDFPGGVEAGADAFLAAARGEPFKGTGKTVAERSHRRASVPVTTIPFAVLPLGCLGLVILLVFGINHARKADSKWARHRFMTGSRSPSFFSSSDSSSSSSSSSSYSDSSSSSSSDFSGGGGDSGGGGSSDSW